MRTLLWMLMTCFTLTFCSCASLPSTIGDGKIDAVEMATLQVAVGLAMNQAPQTVEPTYKVTSALLELTGDHAVSLSEIDVFIDVELDKLEIDALTKQSVKELTILVKAYVTEMLNKEGISQDQRYIVAIDIIKIVNQVAKSRIELQLTVKK